MKKKIVLALVVALTVVALSPCSLWAGIRREGDLYIVDDAEGSAPIGSGGKSAARDAARRNAQRDALERALGATVQGITEMQNYQVVKDKVFSQTQGLVRTFDVLREWEKDGELYISALCKVSFTALDGVLGPVVLDALGNPRVMVLIDERVGNNRVFLSTTEGEVLRVFEKAGYLLVDPSQADVLKEIDLDAARQSSDPEFLREVARTFNADVLISGKADAKSYTSQKKYGQLLYGVRSTVQLKSVLTNSAYMLGSEMVEQKKEALTEEDGAIRGLQPAASIAAKSIVHKIAYAMISGSAGGIPGRTVKIRVAEISFRDATNLKNALQGIDGVTGVYQRQYRDRKLELDIVSDKTAEDIAMTLSDHGIDIEDVNSAVVEGRSEK
ncbi:MAG: flagellar assembly protein T N-terminal domain-containing protein [Synergistaceae bacterium]|nr:flagellar assembly protein T N-terminal domain-containing protein [Synergistaceae bacterium]